MALTSQNISIGSGDLFVTEWLSSYDTALPGDEIETEANRIGHISQGATISYEPSFYTAKDDLGKVMKTILTEEKLALKAGVITWDFNTLAKLISTAATTATTSLKTLQIGGLENYTQKEYLVRFVHVDGLHRITIKASCQSTIDFAFLKDKETTINTEFGALPMTNSRLMVFEETIPTPPTP